MKPHSQPENATRSILASGISGAGQGLDGEREPSANGKQTAGDRDAAGKFAKGNPGGPGNPNAAKANEYRRQSLDAFRSSDIDLAVRTIRRILRSETSKDADKLAAVRELLNRTIGTPVASGLIERIEVLENIIAGTELTKANISADGGLH